MSLASGTRLGPYLIQSAIGAGGMGEVYKARDTRLDRTVAIKVLPPDVSGDAERRARFEREARTIAGLNHAHICTLYDVGTHDPSAIPGQAGMYLVMEYIEGETLADRLLRGPLPLEQALTIAAEIAGALAAAHQQGVIHRDLKPGNVMLTKAGAKLLDFGLAKLAVRGEEPAVQMISGAQTKGETLTGKGVIVGTLQYMAPEQLEGKPPDTRTDLWALGAILYEMVTGKRAFEGTSAASIVGAILEREPAALTLLQPLAPPALERLVRLCLAKDPEARWQSAQDVQRELEWVSEQRREREPQRASRFPWRAALLVLLTAAVAVAGGAVWGRWTSPPRISPGTPVRFVVQLPENDFVNPADMPAVAFAPDGSRLVYVGIRDGTSHLFIRDLKSIDPVLVPGTAGASGPFFAPDGQSIGFFAEGRLRKLSLNGGAPVGLCGATMPRGAAWGRHGMIFFTPSPGTGILRVSENGSAPEAVSQLSAVRKERTHRLVDVLPGDKTAVITVRTERDRSLDEAVIATLDLQTGAVRPVIERGAHARWVTTGHLLFVRSNALYAVPFDAETASVTGKPVEVIDGVMTDPSTGAAQYSVSANGSLAFIAGGPWVPQRALAWVSRTGSVETLDAPVRGYRTPRVSPDGRRIVVSAEAANDDLWILDRGGSGRRLTYEIGSNIAPVWSPDGSRLAFSSNSAGSFNVFIKAVDSVEPPVQLTKGDKLQVPGSWSPDGKLLAFTEQDQAAGGNIFIASLDDGHVQPFLSTGFNEDSPAFSPDGRWIAYVSDESGQREVYVRPFPAEGGEVQISANGGSEPVWTRKGDELLYRDGTRIMAVPLSFSGGLRIGTARVIVDGDYAAGTMAALPSYDISPDGTRVLLVKQARGSLPSRIQVILNWFEELKAKVAPR